MKKLLFLTGLQFVLFMATAQEKNLVVLGRVVDSATRQPLTGASAFCPNTTYGTTSNAEGLFYMRLPSGGYDLMISYTGYEKKIIRLSANQPAGDTMLIELPKQDKAMTEVAVVGSNEVPDGWAKYGKFFLENFVGTSPNASSCQLVNPEALRFFYTKKRNRLKVTAKEDIILVNQALGYAIRYQLDSFNYDYNTNISQFTGYPLFSEIDSTAEAKLQWKKNRARTYLGSRMHFMRSLYDSLASQEGFIVEKLEDNPRSIRGTAIGDLYDPSLYALDSGEVTIGWQGRYRVSYKSVFPDKKFLEDFKLPPNTRYQTTVLDVADGFILERNGYFYEQYDVVNTGYWAWKKLAEQLPYDYRYE